MLLLLTGARLGEVLALRWQDVSEDGVLTFLHTKSGKIRCVGGTDAIRPCLTHCRASIRTFSPVRARETPTRRVGSDACCDEPFASPASTGTA